jgi:hypothetical protein
VHGQRQIELGGSTIHTHRTKRQTGQLDSFLRRVLQNQTDQHRLPAQILH